MTGSSASRLRRTRRVRLHTRERSRGARADRHDLRGGCRGVRRSSARAHVPAKGRSPRGAQTPRLRRVGLRRNRGGAARQLPRRPRHGGLQHEESRARALARSRPRHRLHAGGLHQERRDVRRRLRCRRQALVPTQQTIAEPGRDVRRDRSRVHVARAPAGPPDPTDRRQEGGDRDHQVLQGRRPPPERPHRRGQVPGGHRSPLPAGRRGRSDTVRRDGTEDRQRRLDGELDERK